MNEQLTSAAAADAARASSITFEAVFRRSVREYPDNVALYDGQTRLTYQELDADANRVGRALADLGAESGDRIAVLSEPRAEFVQMLVASAKSGVATVGLNTRLHPEELAHCIREAEPKVLFVSPEMLGLGRAVVERIGEDLEIIRFGEDDERHRSFTDLVEKQSAEALDVLVSAEDIHLIIHTSGTTGIPKAAMISQRAAAARAFRLAHCLQLTEDDCFVDWLPLFHTGGTEMLNSHLLAGAGVSTVPSADPVSICSAIERDGGTVLPLLAGMFEPFDEYSASTSHELQSLRLAFGFANQLPHDALDGILRRHGMAYADLYGQTETGIMIAMALLHAGSIDTTYPKRLAPYLDVLLVDEDSQPVPVGTPGECVIRCPTAASGYLNDAEKTANLFKGGWVRTGDVLTADEDGNVRFVDRTKALIKSGGENVYPAEVERALMTHPDIVETCVVSAEDPTWGEAVRAFVSVREGASLSGEEVVGWCRERIASYKRPRYVRFMQTSEYPRTATNKIIAAELAEVPVAEDELVERSSP